MSQFYDALAKAPSPGFRCVVTGIEYCERFVVRVFHEFRLPASNESLETIRERLGALGTEVIAFYEQHDGCSLYCDSLSDVVGIELLSVEVWDEAIEDLRSWYRHLLEEPENDPDHIVTGIPFAMVPGSGNYFVMPVEGPNAGKVFYANHDGWYESAFANSFNEFLMRLTEDPVHLLNEELGGYTRYSDGEGETDGIPEEFFPDVSAIQE